MNCKESVKFKEVNIQNLITYHETIMTHFIYYTLTKETHTLIKLIL